MKDNQEFFGAVLATLRLKKYFFFKRMYEREWTIYKTDIQ